MHNILASDLTKGLEFSSPKSDDQA